METLRSFTPLASAATLLFQTVPDHIQSKLAFIKTDPLPWKESVLAFSWAVWAFETYLLYRQYPNYARPAPPPELAAHFPQEKFDKGQKYGASKAKFSVVSMFYSQILDTLLIVFDSYAKMWQVAGDLLARFGYDSSYEITQSLVWASLMFLLQALPSIPLSYYQTFVLEEKYGFNKSTRGLFIADILKGWLVGGLIGLPFLALFLYIIRWAGASFIPYLMAFIISSQLIMVVIYPIVIQPLFNKLSPLPEGALRTRIESLAGSLKFPLKHLYVIDGSKRSSHSNAYFYGLPWSKHIVIFDTLIEKTSPEEIEAVLAHELGHWQYSHPSKLLVISQLYLFSILTTFPPFLQSAPLLRSFGFPPSVAAHPPIIIAFMLFQQVQGPIDTVIKVGMNFMSRRFEYQADHFACELDEARGAESDLKSMSERLGDALITLHVGNLSTVWVDWIFSTWHHSHPTLTERLRAMEQIRKSQSEKGSQKMKKEL